ncbi:MAG: M13 family metallopeptidase [Bacteroidota bacterium]
MKKKAIVISSVVAGLSASAFVYTALKGVDVASMDKNVNPTENFYEYANGNWIKNNPIPSTESRWSSFNIVAERNNELLRTILETSAKTKAAAGTSQDKVGKFYRVAMDTMKLEQQKFDALKKYFGQIDAISNKEELITRIAQLHKLGVGAVFGFEISQDVKKSDKYSPYIAQGGLGLPDKDYYLKTDERSQKIKEEYVKYTDAFMGMADAEMGIKHETDPQYGKKILAFETELAQACMSRTERRNMEVQYNPMAFDKLQGSTPQIDWNLYFNTIGLKKELAEYYIVMQPAYMAVVNKLMVYDLNTWKMYLKWKLLNSTAPYLHKRVVDTNFGFYGTLLTGAKEQKPRWKRVIGHANGMIGELVGQEFVKVAFTPESKKRVNELVDNLSASFHARINSLEWMSPVTKTKAMEKLKSFTRKLGYPDKWTDMSKLAVTEDYYVNNVFSSSNFWFEFNLNKLGKPVDKTEWEMLPQTVNAYYNPVNNEIVFPAAIMQPPFFDPKADDAVNYGAIGAVIGHEFSHGFDDQGSKYDASGNLNDWWTENDRKLFDARTKLLVEQFNKFEVLDSVYVNGELTLGENIADLAGLTVAYDAYQRSLKIKPSGKIDGYTPEQRFFIGFGQVWRGHARPEFLRQQVVTDPHSPAQFRVLGTLSNMPEFYSAFGVKSGDKMYREETNRVKIW